MNEYEVILTTDIYSNNSDTHQYLKTMCHPKTKLDNISIGITDHKCQNWLDNVNNGMPFRNRVYIS